MSNISNLSKDALLEALSSYLRLPRGERLAYFSHSSTMHREMESILGTPRLDNSYKSGNISVRFSEDSVYVNTPDSMERFAISDGFSTIKEYIEALLEAFNKREPEKNPKLSRGPERKKGKKGKGKGQRGAVFMPKKTH